MTISSPSTTSLEQALCSFDAAERRAALEQLAGSAGSGETPLPPPKQEVNLHLHTFFSYNAHGWSPSRVAWEARKYGLEAAGIVDFDVLHGMSEFLSAAGLLRLKSAAGLETRVYIREFADQVINSPGEPGIAYFMAEGCYALPEPGTQAEATLTGLYQTARERNLGLMQRVNEHLAPVTLDYETDVLPLTPSGNATERHLLAAYDSRARGLFPDERDLASFWAEKLGLPSDDAAKLTQDRVKLQETLRSRLMKKGGVAYVQPDSGSFPTLEAVVAFARDVGAIPCGTYLDGTNPGESDMGKMLDLLQSKGVVALNIIPDRNWNIKDPDEKALKVRKLGECVQAARERGMPLVAGTEMNKLGLPFVDNFGAPELEPYRADFLSGAHFIWGHTFLASSGYGGYFSGRIDAAFGNAWRRRIKFFELVGRLPYPNPHPGLDPARRHPGLDPARRHPGLDPGSIPALPSDALDLDPEHLLNRLQEG